METARPDELTRPPRGSVKQKREMVRFVRFQEQSSAKMQDVLRVRANHLIQDRDLWHKKVEIHGTLPFTFVGTLEPFSGSDTNPYASNYVVVRFGPKSSVRIPKATIIALAEL